MIALLKTLVPSAMLALLVAACAGSVSQADEEWSADELKTIRSLWIGSLAPLPAHTSNRVADDPRAVALGHRLFFDERMSSNGRVSCATCHQPSKGFQDGLPLAQGVGTTGRRTPTIVGIDYSPWLFWDGRKDSPWSQALGPLESPVEHGGTRAQYAHHVAEHYRDAYEAIFGSLPDLARVPRRAGPVDDPEARASWDRLSDNDRDAVNRIFANIGKAIAAYERRIQFGPSRFDRYVEGRATLGADERAGLRLFIGRANCVQCHNGPLFTDNSFHNIAVPARAGTSDDRGRIDATEQVLADEFNGRGRYADGGDATELEFMVRNRPELVGAFRTPTLRNVAERTPFMHAGQLATIDDVIAHYSDAPAARIGHSELVKLDLSRAERRQLAAFLSTLSGPLAAPPELLRAPAGHGGTP